MKRFFATCLTLWVGTAFAADDVALVTELQGRVNYGGGEAKPFMRLRDGDRLAVASNGMVRILYVASGRQEIYQGPAGVAVGRENGRAESGSAPSVSHVPMSVASQVGITTAAFENLKLGRMGGITIRGAPPSGQNVEISAARRTYSSLRGSAAENDITPELYLYAILREHGQTAEMKSLLNEMRRRQPRNEVLDAIIAAAARAGD